jgi:hypothetical protein
MQNTFLNEIEIEKDLKKIFGSGEGPRVVFPENRGFSGKPSGGGTLGLFCKLSGGYEQKIQRQGRRV